MSKHGKKSVPQSLFGQRDGTKLHGRSTTKRERETRKEERNFLSSLTETYEMGGRSDRAEAKDCMMAKKAVIPMVTRSDIDPGPNQYVVNVIKTIKSDGVKTPASLFAILLFSDTLTVTDE